jgi:hypothetical protein
VPILIIRRPAHRLTHRHQATPRGAQPGRPDGQVLAGDPSQPLPELLRRGEAQVADLVEGLDLGRAGRSLGYHQRPDRLHPADRKNRASPAP